MLFLARRDHDTSIKKLHHRLSHLSAIACDCPRCTANTQHAQHAQHAHEQFPPRLIMFHPELHAFPCQVYQTHKYYNQSLGMCQPTWTKHLCAEANRWWSYIPTLHAKVKSCAEVMHVFVRRLGAGNTHSCHVI